MGFPALLVGGPSRLVEDPALLWFLVLSTSLCVVEAALARARPPRGDDESARAVALGRRTGGLLLVGYWLAVAERAVAGSRPVGAATVFGIGLMLAGIVLRAGSIRALGRWFGSELSVAAGQPLVREGVFGWVRHPSELGLLAVGLGGPLALASATGAGLWLIGLVPCVLARVELEEASLRATFGDEYRGYARDVPKLLPRVS